MGERALGMAADFYRLRLLRLDEAETPDLEWRDDILYREPPRQRMAEYQEWVVEAVVLPDEDRAISLSRFDDYQDAQEYMEAAEEALAALTRSEFEARYFPAA